ncbi:plastin-3 [Anaeramoeba flamelloides]|uniref:Plastin-3 n=1 Tax=Anaeramoeba flamelloides TaxID=1746091 RepID=A0ABQ8XUI7_9EUKA|nr:plastin-3 [Anaeramoeba flamelloides]
MTDFYQMAKEFPQFKREEIDEFIEQFNSFDLDRSGSIDEDELIKVMKQLGEKMPAFKIRMMIKEVDIDGNGEIEFNEFLQLITNIRSGKTDQQKGFARIYNKQSSVIKLKGATDSSTHSFADDEKESFVNFINSTLYNDPIVKNRLPINPENMDIFEELKDGIILCKMINDAIPGTIDERVINTKKLNKFTKVENQNLAINSAKAIGCNVVNIGQSDIEEAKVHLLLGLLWQIIRIGLLRRISITECPELYKLLEDGETLEDLLKLSPDQILLRWMNYHLKNAGSNRRAKNYTTDIMDSEIYTTVLNQIAPDECSLSPMNTQDKGQRAELMLQEAENIECRKFVSPSDVVRGNPKLNLAFVANMFNTRNGLGEIEIKEMPVIEEEDREARTFATWLNSIGCEPFVTRFYLNLRDGLILLQAFDHITKSNPNCNVSVNWNKVAKNPRNKFQALGNCNYVIELGKQLGFSLVGIGGSDINEGHKMLTLALVWQMVRYHVTNVLFKLSKTGRALSDSELVDLVNQKVYEAGKENSISSLSDPNLANSFFIADLCDSIRPGCINYDLLVSTNNEEELIKNANYVISCGRKIGAVIFCLPEDIVEVKPKMMLTIFAALLVLTC